MADTQTERAAHPGETLGSYLLRVRLGRGDRQLDVSNWMARHGHPVEQHTVSRWEADMLLPRGGQLLDLAAYLRCSVATAATCRLNSELVRERRRAAQDASRRL